MIDTIGGLESVELILERLRRTKANSEFLATLNKEI